MGQQAADPNNYGHYTDVDGRRYKFYSDDVDYRYLARSANLPTGLYILPSVISSIFTMSKASVLLKIWIFPNI